MDVASSAPPEPMSMKAVLGIATMRRMWYAQIVSVFGDFVALFAVINTMTFHLHATAQQVTGVQIAYIAPIAVLGVLSGVFVDRWPLKVTMVASDLTRAALCLLLLFVHSVWGFYAVLAGISIFSSFFGPAQGVAIRSVVPLHGLRSANALLQQVMLLMRILGPTVAGLIVRLLGERACYIADSLSFVASGLMMASLVLARPSVVGDALEGGAELRGLRKIWADMKRGIGFIFGHAALLFVVTALAAGMFVMGCFGPLIAVYVRDTLRLSTQTFAFASGSIGAGLLVGISALNALAKNASEKVLVYCGLAGIGLSTLLLALFPHVVLLFVGCILIGVAAGAIIVPAQTLVQRETPPALMGRVGSSMMSAIFGAQVAGLVLSGVLAQYTSVRRVFLFCTVMVAVLMVGGRLFMEPKHSATTATV